MSWPEQVFFRVDASFQIGSGHVMRCLTLARELTEGGSSCSFICRNLVGNLIDFIRSWGFQVHILPEEDTSNNNSQLAHASWLGGTWQNDSQQCKEILADRKIDLLVVDSYALDHEWEKSLQENFAKILVIDDLKDRSHYCDFLLDQTHGRKSREYEHLVPEACEVFCGSEYALLRKEFAQLRGQSLKRQQQSNESKNLLISMGGVDRENFTGRLLEKLEESGSYNFDISVVLSARAPHYHSVKTQIHASDMNVELLSDVSDMANLMAAHDIALGASGSSAWERCCLGLPAIIMILAENQKVIAQSLVDAGASLLYDFERGPELDECLSELLSNKNALSTAAAKVCTGRGCPELMKKMKQSVYAD